jgi:class 3 adenylate cyclase
LFSEENMKCSSCGFENREGAKFCGKCRAKLSRVCAQCNTENSPENVFCDECGHDLEPIQEPRPIDYSQPTSYTPKHLTDKILTTRSSIEGERKWVTVLFADVANYTSLAEKLDPEEVHQVMNGCFKILTDETHEHEGTINQFTGDGVMGLFGAPVAHEDHAQRACHAALSIRKAVEEYGEKIRKECGVEFKMRIGLNSGPVIVGSIGDDLRMDYTAVGDTTNLAARMESMAEPGSILVSGNTYRMTRDYFTFEPLGQVEVKGKEEPQEAFELVKASEVETRIGASVAKGLTGFVGRTNSMAVLAEAYQKAVSGAGQIVGLVGEAGVGKSRLVLEFVNRLLHGGFTYLEGRCLHYGGAMAYLPILGIVRSYFGILETDREYLIKKKIRETLSPFGEVLESAIAPLHDLLSVPVEDSAYRNLEPRQKHDRTFEAIRDVLVRGSQQRPLVIAVEDVHWIDRTSEEFLDYLIGWLANTHIVLILAYRPEYTHQWGSKSYYNRVGLDHLSTQRSAELVRSILGADVVPELRQLILSKAAGNPLFMEEITYALLESGSIQKEDDHYILRGHASGIEIPDTIQGIISARMDRLEDNLKRIMQVASVIGRDFAYRILQTITGMREELKSQLLNLQGLEFIYEKSLFPELEYIFRHALTQEVAYHSLLSKRRKEIHERIGEAIEKLYPGRLDEHYERLAYHYKKSNDPEKAIRFMSLVAKKAVDRFANQEAMTFCEEGLEILDQLDDTQERRQLRSEIELLLISARALSGEIAPL